MGLDTHVSMNDWISLAVGVVGLITALLMRSNRLPAEARSWLARIGPDRITGAIETAAAIAKMTPSEKRARAVSTLQAVSMKEFGLPVPTSIANLLVEQIYQRWKRGR
jgi:hypothetical protein